MHYWTKEDKSKISSLIDDKIRWIDTGFNSYNGRTTPICSDVIKNSDLIIGYNNESDLYVVWNALLHQKDGCENQTFAVPKKYVWSHSEQYIDDLIYPVYRKIHGKTPFCEKIVIVKPEFLQEFCKAPFSYLLPDHRDIGFAKNTLFACPNDKSVVPWTDNKYTQYLPDTYREYYSCKRAKRDALFKKRVFNKYDIPHCVVCGITIQSVLEAAHIIAVKDGGNDEPENGICLCRNHHRLLDEQLIFVDDNKHVFRIMDKAVAESLKCECDVDYSFK